MNNWLKNNVCLISHYIYLIRHGLIKIGHDRILENVIDKRKVLSSRMIRANIGTLNMDYILLGMMKSFSRFQDDLQKDSRSAAVYEKFQGPRSVQGEE